MSIDARRAMAAVASLASTLSLSAVASPAMAIPGWRIGEEAAAVGATDPSLVSAGVVAGVLHGVLNATLFVAVSVFVLRVVLTAVDRMVLSNHGEEWGHRLSEIPVIGAYPDPLGSEEDEQERFAALIASGGRRRRDPVMWTWGRIFKTFAVQLAVAVGSWVIVGALISMVAGIYGVAAG